MGSNVHGTQMRFADLICGHFATHVPGFPEVWSHTRGGHKCRLLLQGEWGIYDILLSPHEVMNQLRCTLEDPARGNLNHVLAGDAVHMHPLKLHIRHRGES
jgi:hypothetical protein